jgi:hypothetical protein
LPVYDFPFLAVFKGPIFGKRQTQVFGCRIMTCLESCETFVSFV